jgi:hypothetical protein
VSLRVLRLKVKVGFGSVDRKFDVVVAGCMVCCECMCKLNSERVVSVYWKYNGCGGRGRDLNVNSSFLLAAARVCVCRRRGAHSTFLFAARVLLNLPCLIIYLDQRLLLLQVVMCGG